MSKYDVAAFVWPAYSGADERSRLFWPQGNGEWESVKNAVSKFDGHQWPRKPQWGYADEADPTVMEMEIDEAAKHGVNVLIYDWYYYDGRPFFENCLCDGYLKAKNNDKVKFYLMWANHDIGFTWDIRNSDREGNYTLEKAGTSTLYKGSVSREVFEKAAKRMIDLFFKHPSYYKIDGKPVLMIFTLPVLIEGLGGLKKTREALLWFKNECVKCGLSGLHIQLNMHKVCREIYDGDRRVPTDELVSYLGIDSMTNYQSVNLVEKIDEDYGKILEESYETWENIANGHSIPYFPQVSVGWDNNPRFKELKRPAIINNTPQKFEDGLRHAKSFIDRRSISPRLVTVNSWNEWTEGSYLEPDDINGYGYLEAVKKVFVDEV